MTVEAETALPVEDPRPRRRRRLVGGLVLAALVAVVAAVLVPRLGGPDNQPAVLVGHRAPSLQGQTLDGGRFDLTDWRGSVVLVNVWGSWCYPCRQEQPLLASAYAALQPRGLRMVGIDVRDPAGAAKAFLAQYGGAAAGNAPWPSVVDPDGAHAVDWGTYALPETYLIGPDGTVVAKSTGVVTPQWIDEHVVPLLGRAAP